jgi:hypothetical protein
MHCSFLVQIIKPQHGLLDSICLIIVALILAEKEVEYPLFISKLVTACKICIGSVLQGLKLFLRSEGQTL